MFFLQVIVCLVCGALFGCVMYSLVPPLRRLHNLAGCVAIGALANIILFYTKVYYWQSTPLDVAIVGNVSMGIMCFGYIAVKIARSKRSG